MSKLVRDGLVGRIPSDELATAPTERMGALLDDKLSEEVSELRASGFRDPEEFADVIEVLLALAALAGLSASDIEEARLRKLDRRGGFDRRLLWTPCSP